jgi:hypothetical protein
VTQPVACERAEFTRALAHGFARIPVPQAGR